MTIESYVRGSELGSEIELYEIDFRNLAGGDVVRLTPSVVEGRTSIWFGGMEFTCHPVKLEGVQWDGKNAPTQPTITMAQIGLLGSSLIDANDSLIGAKLTRYRTFERYLDSIVGVDGPGSDYAGAEPDFEQRFPDEVYYFEQLKTFVPGEIASFVLDTISSSRNRVIPGRAVIKRVCSRRYRFYDASTGEFSYSNISSACPYVGVGCWDKNGQPTTADNDRCGHLERDCKLRFPNEPLPGFFFPGVSASRL